MIDRLISPGWTQAPAFPVTRRREGAALLTRACIKSQQVSQQIQALEGDPVRACSGAPTTHVASTKLDSSPLEGRQVNRGGGRVCCLALLGCS